MGDFLEKILEIYSNKKKIYQKFIIKQKVILEFEIFFLLFIQQVANCSNRFTGLSRNGHSIHFKSVFLADSQHSRIASKDQRICILEENRPFPSFLLPFLRQSTHIKQSMHISMSVWLCVN